MVSVYLWVLNVVSIPKDKSESVVCTAGPLISPLPCPKGPDASPGLSNGALSNDRRGGRPPNSLHPDLRDRHHHEDSHNGVLQTLQRTGVFGTQQLLQGPPVSLQTGRSRGGSGRTPYTSWGRASNRRGQNFLRDKSNLSGVMPSSPRLTTPTRLPQHVRMVSLHACT